MPGMRRTYSARPEWATSAFATDHIPLPPSFLPRVWDRPALTKINASIRRRYYPEPMKRLRLRSTVVVAALVAAQIGISSAAPQQLRCALASSQTAAQNQPIVVVFDDAAKTLQAQSGTQFYNFTDVSISNVAISGNAGTVSLGIDRSSLGIVWQQYAAEKTTIEYGQCQNSAAPSA